MKARGGHVLALHVLASTRARAGDQVDRVRAVFERAAAFANDLGLLAEEVDPQSSCTVTFRRRSTKSAW